VCLEVTAGTIVGVLTESLCMGKMRIHEAVTIRISELRLAKFTKAFSP
jgi:hypothetical protein